MIGDEYVGKRVRMIEALGMRKREDKRDDINHLFNWIW